LVTICSGVCLVHFMLRVSWPQPAAVGTLIGLDQDLGGTSVQPRDVSELGGLG